MRSFTISFAVGLVVGLLYAFLRVRSPAPPLIALVGLLGMVLGEQLLPALIRLASQLGFTWKS
jgi:XapX domain-containing protein